MIDSCTEIRNEFSEMPQIDVSNGLHPVWIGGTIPDMKKTRLLEVGTNPGATTAVVVANCATTKRNHATRADRLLRRKHPAIYGNQFWVVTGFTGKPDRCIAFLRRLRQRDGVGLEEATTVFTNGESFRFEPVDLSTLTKAQKVHFAGWLAMHGGAE
jgi:hypothetical protein